MSKMCAYSDFTPFSHLREGCTYETVFVVCRLRSEFRSMILAVQDSYCDLLNSTERSFIFKILCGTWKSCYNVETSGNPLQYACQNSKYEEHKNNWTNRLFRQLIRRVWLTRCACQHSTVIFNYQKQHGPQCYSTVRCQVNFIPRFKVLEFMPLLEMTGFTTEKTYE